LPRPSSATNAKASAMHPLYLDTFTYISTQFDVLHQQNFMSKNRCSIKNNYITKIIFNIYQKIYPTAYLDMELTGIEPATSCLQSTRSPN
jgi:hypothetical protein